MSTYGALTFGVVGLGGAGASFDWQDDGSFKVSTWDPSGGISATLTAAQVGELGGYLAGVLGPIPQPAPVAPPEPSSPDDSSSTSPPSSPSSPPTSSSSASSSGDSGA